MPTTQQLRADHEQLINIQRRLQLVTEIIDGERATVRDELNQAAAAELRLVPLGQVDGPPDGYVAKYIPVGEIDEACAKLGRFAASELAAVLRCTTSRAIQHMKRLPDGRVVARGHWGGSKMYDYIPPTAPTPILPVPRVAVGDLARAGSAVLVRQSMVRSIADKELRKVVLEAIADGWEIVQSGGEHPMRLVREGNRFIPVASTPRNSGNAANDLRRKLRRANA